MQVRFPREAEIGKPKSFAPKSRKWLAPPRKGRRFFKGISHAHEILKQIPGIWKSREMELQRFVGVVLWILRTGTAWADLPSV
jgi:hypothetical protein